jgi:hypothetical protein
MMHLIIRQTNAIGQSAFYPMIFTQKPTYGHGNWVMQLRYQQWTMIQSPLKVTDLGDITNSGDNLAGAEPTCLYLSVGATSHVTVSHIVLPLAKLLYISKTQPHYGHWL